VIFAAAASDIIKLRRARGFTLIELLVVIIIIGIVISFATLAIRGTDPEDLIKTDAQRFNQLLELALEDATFKGLDYGIAFTPNSYTFVYLDDHHEWQALSGDRLLRKRELEHNIEINLEFDQGNNAPPAAKTSKKLVPQVLLYSSGEIDPAFTAYFSIPGFNQSYQVHGYSDGQHKVKKTK
jgi:general secretion pathway protein H